MIPTRACVSFGSGNTLDSARVGRMNETSLNLLRIEVFITKLVTHVVSPVEMENKVGRWERRTLLRTTPREGFCGIKRRYVVVVIVVGTTHRCNFPLSQSPSFFRSLSLFRYRS